MLYWKCIDQKAETMCAYISTTGAEKNWKTASCFDLEGYACTVPAGQSIHPVPKPDQYKCPAYADVSFAWLLSPFTNKCYLFPRWYDGETDGDSFIGDYDHASDFCIKNQGILASIHTEEENSWLTSHAVNDMWIGIKGTSSSNAIPKTWTSDGTSVDFNAFQSGGPVLGTALLLSHMPENNWRGHWFVQNDTEHHHPPICMRDALPGAPDPPEVPTAPPNEFCDPGWHVMINEDGKMKCVQVQSGDRTWQASLDQCIALGASLFALNSPKDLEVSTLFPLYPSAIGKFSLRILGRSSYSLQASVAGASKITAY